MEMKKIILFYFLCSIFKLYGQQEGNVWLMGYTYAGAVPLAKDSKFGLINMNFYQPPFPNYIKEFDRGFQSGGVNTSICTDSNRIDIFYNGMNVYNRNYKIMENGDTINYNYNNTKTPHDVFAQEGLLLAYPGKKKQYLLLHMQSEWHHGIYICGMRIYQSVIDLNKNNGLGKVTVRKKLFLEDSLDIGRMASVRHANGRDWWILVQRNDKSEYYKFLLTPQGLTIHSTQKIGKSEGSSVGQAVFSPDGKTYVNYNGAGEVFDFDRCSGLLSNARKINFVYLDFYGSGVAISPNSRFAYVSIFDYLYQYDLWAADIDKSKILIATNDGFKNDLGLGCYFNYAQLAPNGKVYVAPRGSIQYLHVINEPDKLGAACGFVIRGVELASYHDLGLPNHPNFALGALKGSPCDTLKSVATKDVEEENVKIYPNPAADVLNVSMPNAKAAKLIIKDISGRILESTDFINQAMISTANYFNGMIFCEVWQSNQLIETKRIVILH
jgi:hypothetical protein